MTIFLKPVSFLILISALCLTLGCASTDATRAESNFGNSVRNMIKSQIYDPMAAQNPPKEPPLTLDGNKSEQILETYRSDVAKPEEITKPLATQRNR